MVLHLFITQSVSLVLLTTCLMTEISWSDCNSFSSILSKSKLNRIRI